MDSGWAAIGGSLVGGLCTFGGTLLVEYLKGKRARKLDKIRKSHLLKMLSLEQKSWRSLSMLSAAIGADEETTTALLLEIGARRSMTDSDSWSLLSRNPFPEFPNESP